jgi:uncharacterized protein
MKIIIAGGTGHLGEKLVEHWQQKGHDVVVITRGGKSRARTVQWDGVNDGDWVKELEGAHVVVNLAGRSVNCRYTRENLELMMNSRVNSTRAIGRAIAQAKSPPGVWLQMSTATIYAHTFQKANDEHTGIIGGNEPHVPGYWKYSIDIAFEWERAQQEALTPKTRKVALRTSMVMGKNPQSVFGVLASMTRWGLGGTIAGGHQWVSWIHEDDFVRALDFLIENSNMSGAVNVCAPHPMSQKDFMSILRKTLGIWMGLPATAWMVKVGAVFMRTDAELLLKSRKVIPSRLLESGFEFNFPKWQQACESLVSLKNEGDVR